MEDCSISFNHTIILHYYTTLYSLESLTLLIRYEYLKNFELWCIYNDEKFVKYQFQSNLSGGHNNKFYNKYAKYKNKYLRLKNKNTI